MDFKFSTHAVEEVERRKIPVSFVKTVLKDPQQILEHQAIKYMITPTAIVA